MDSTVVQSLKIVPYSCECLKVSSLILDGACISTERATAAQEIARSSRPESIECECVCASAVVALIRGFNNNGKEHCVSVRMRIVPYVCASLLLLFDFVGGSEMHQMLHGMDSELRP